MENESKSREGNHVPRRRLNSESVSESVTNAQDLTSRNLSISTIYGTKPTDDTGMKFWFSGFIFFNDKWLKFIHLIF